MKISKKFWDFIFRRPSLARQILKSEKVEMSMGYAVFTSEDFEKLRKRIEEQNPYGKACCSICRTRDCKHFKIETLSLINHKENT